MVGTVGFGSNFCWHQGEEQYERAIIKQFSPAVAHNLHISQHTRPFAAVPKNRRPTVLESSATLDAIFTSTVKLILFDLAQSTIVAVFFDCMTKYMYSICRNGRERLLVLAS